MTQMFDFQPGDIFKISQWTGNIILSKA